MTWELEAPPLRLRTGSMLESTNVEQMREVPYVVRGRDPELSNLLGSVAQPPSVLRLILGPPRSGKTSLLNYLEMWALQHEMHVVRIEGQALNNDTVLAATINPEGAKRRSTRGGGALRAGTELIGGELGASVEVQTDPGSNIRRALEAATQRHRRGILLTIDEVETLINEQDPAATGRLRQLIQFMHRTIVQPQSGGRLLSAVLVATGSLTAIGDLRQAQITGIEGRQTVRLGPVGSKAAARIIEDHWEYGKPLSVDEMPHPPAEWLAGAIEGCDGFVRHVQDLGLEASRQAVRIAGRGGQRFEDEDIEQLELTLAESRDGLYNNRWESAGCEGHGPTAMAATVLAMASVAWQNRIPEEAVYDLTQAVVTDATATDPDKAERLRVMSALQRAGVIENRKLSLSFTGVVNRKDARPHWTMPIPSLATHILKIHGGRLAKEINLDSPLVRQWLQPDESTRHEYEVPPWEWWDIDGEEYS